MCRCLSVSAALLIFVSGSVTSALGTEVTVNIHNDIRNKDLWLYLQYTADGNSINVNPDLPNGQYKQPWQSEALALNQPFKFTFQNINGGKLYFGLMGPNSVQFFSNNAAPPSNSDAFFGFIEFAFLTTDTHVTWDISNVDQLAMLCGLQCNNNGPPPAGSPTFTKCGYNTVGQPLLLAGLLKACNLPANTNTNSAYLACGPSLQYRKLASPSIITAPYQSIMDNYLTQLANNGVKVTFVSDDLVSIGGPASVNFSGTFGVPTINPSINSTDPIVLTLTGDDSDKTVIYLTNQGLNGTSVFQSDSSEGMYVYQNGVQKADNVHLNWASPPPGYLGQEVSSVVRNLLTSMNLGEIKYSKNAVYNQNYPVTWAKAYSGKYYNFYNKFIVERSNSYGMPYSDAAHAKVQYYSSPNATIDLHALAPLDPLTFKYYDASSATSNAVVRELGTLVFGHFFGNLPLDLTAH
jgi:hypothetical protein